MDISSEPAKRRLTILSNASVFQPSIHFSGNGGFRVSIPSTRATSREMDNPLATDSLKLYADQIKSYFPQGNINSSNNHHHHVQPFSMFFDVTFDPNATQTATSSSSDGSNYSSEGTLSSINTNTNTFSSFSDGSYISCLTHNSSNDNSEQFNTACKSLEENVESTNEIITDGNKDDQVTCEYAHIHMEIPRGASLDELATTDSCRSSVCSSVVTVVPRRYLSHDALHNSVCSGVASVAITPTSPKISPAKVCNPLPSSSLLSSPSSVSPSSVPQQQQLSSASPFVSNDNSAQRPSPSTTTLLNNISSPSSSSSLSSSAVPPPLQAHSTACSSCNEAILWNWNTHLSQCAQQNNVQTTTSVDNNDNGMIDNPQENLVINSSELAQLPVIHTYQFSTLDEEHLQWLNIQVKQVRKGGQFSMLPSNSVNNESDNSSSTNRQNVVHLLQMHCPDIPVGFDENRGGSVWLKLRVYVNLIKPIKISLKKANMSLSQLEGLSLSNPAANDLLENLAMFLPRGTCKEVLIQDETTAREAIQALLDNLFIKEASHRFALYEHSIESDQTIVVSKLPNECNVLNFIFSWIDHGNPVVTKKNFLAKRIVLQEDEPTDIKWNEFSLPELRNFIRILDQEEKQYREGIKIQYALCRRQLEGLLQQRQSSTFAASNDNSSPSPPPAAAATTP